MGGSREREGGGGGYIEKVMVLMRIGLRTRRLIGRYCIRKYSRGSRSWCGREGELDG